MTRAVAADLVQRLPRGSDPAQIEDMDWLRETKPKRVADVGAYLAEAIRKDFAAPAGFRSRAERAEAEATARARQEREARGPSGEGPRARGEARIAGYWKGLTPDERQRLEAAALAGAAAGDRAAYEAATGPVRRLLLVGLRDALAPAPARPARGGLTGKGPSRPATTSPRPGGWGSCSEYQYRPGRGLCRGLEAETPATRAEPERRPT